MAVAFSLSMAETTIIKDPATNLMWEDTVHVEEGKVSYLEANSYCQSLKLGNHNDWRVPTLKELLSIVDYTRHEPATLKEFNHVDQDKLYWSSTEYTNKSTEFWGVVFENGNTDNASAIYDRRVRCVRAMK
jgi:hypothetical protein